MSSPQSTSSGHLTHGQVAGLLRHEHRRAILTFLDRKTTDYACFDELIDYVVAWDSEGGEPSVDRRERIVIGLLHNHLPRLADADVLEYDERSETVRYRGDSRLESILEDVFSEERTI